MQTQSSTLSIWAEMVETIIWFETIWMHAGKTNDKFDINNGKIVEFIFRCKQIA